MMEEKKQKELSPEELKQKLKECQKQKDQYLAGWQRARADFLNYKKQEMERISEIVKYANEGLILNLLSVLDNFEIAEKKMPAHLKKDENIRGFLQIKRQLKEFLKKQGLEEIEVADKEFDPAFQAVVEEIEVKGKEAGIVLEEIQKGYKLHGKVIRPAKVKISR